MPVRSASVAQCAIGVSTSPSDKILYSTAKSDIVPITRTAVVAVPNDRRAAVVRRVRNHALRSVIVTAIVKLPRRPAFEWSCGVEQIVPGRWVSTYGPAKTATGQFNSLDAAVRAALRKDLMTPEDDLTEAA